MTASQSLQNTSTDDLLGDTVIPIHGPYGRRTVHMRHELIERPP